MIQHQIESILGNSVGTVATYSPRPDNLAILSSIGIARSEPSSFDEGSDGGSAEERSYGPGEVYRSSADNRNQYCPEGKYDWEKGQVEGHGQARTLSLSKLTLLRDDLERQSIRF
jgi:hypothetical protein